MIRVFSFHPEHFNNNGDQGNLEALSFFTGQEIEYVAPEQADFVLIGDASRAAMRHYQTELEGLVELLDQRFANGEPTLIVGSAYEFFLERIPLSESISRSERVSEFRVVQADGITIKGYRNTDLVRNDAIIRGSFIGTTLYGPVLAKNPELLERVCKSLGLEVLMGDQEREWISKI